jgi:hypothetical protein
MSGPTYAKPIERTPEGDATGRLWAILTFGLLGTVVGSVAFVYNSWNSND